MPIHNANVDTERKNRMNVARALKFLFLQRSCMSVAEARRMDALDDEAVEALRRRLWSCIVSYMLLLEEIEISIVVQFVAGIDSNEIYEWLLVISYLI